MTDVVNVDWNSYYSSWHVNGHPTEHVFSFYVAFLEVTPEANSGLYETAMMVLFCENNARLIAVDYFLKYSHNRCSIWPYRRLCILCMHERPSSSVSDQQKRREEFVPYCYFKNKNNSLDF